MFPKAKEPKGKLVINMWKGLLGEKKAWFICMLI